MSIEDKAAKIRVLMAQMNLKGSELAKLYGKSKQFISSLKQVEGLERQQDELIVFLENLTKERAKK